jgi:hypothetical protein
MQMNIKKPKGLLKDSIIIMDFMSGEDKMYYLERMWDLYFKVFNTKVKKSSSRKKTSSMRQEKAYELCTSLIKIFGH